MPQFSQAISKLKASSTVVFNTRAQEMKRQGIDVVAMTAGEPDFQPPDHVLEAARDAVDQGLTKYTPAEGTFELREAVCGKFARENNLEYTPEQIIVGTGGKQILYNGFMAVLNPGDEVIIIAPYWVTYPAQIELAGGVPVPVSAPPETGFIPDIDDIRSAITARTRAIVLNSPANPTGAVYPPEVVISIAELVNEHDLWLFADDLYEHLIYDGKFTAAASYARERTLIIHGASKAYALTGWRIGYGAGPIDLIKAMNRLQGQSTSGANSIAQYAVTVALNEFDKTRAFIDMTLEAYRERRNLLVSGLNRMGLKTPNPRGAFYVMSDLTVIDPNENKAALRLLEDAHVGVVPGTDFLAPGHARFSYATSLDNVTEALERISRLLN
ncbi:MAG: aspartate aminotransferase [Trueperaceae bacterium]|nr:aspartate aminotransferase [Trueperaceae bacterium]|tara:strand:- start:16589 stop:17743 length:1155 start_codon:yes stop_codon:yes gene_type:complete